MLHSKLNSHYLETVLTTSAGKTYTAGNILHKSELLERSLSCIGVSTEDTVGIYVKNEMYGIASIIACLTYGTNFVILDYSDNLEDTKVKTVLTKLSYGVIIAEEVIDDTLLTLHPGTFKIISKGWNYSTLEEEEKDYMSKIFNIISNIPNNETPFKTIEKVPLKREFLNSSYYFVAGITFNNGISKGLYNASKIAHNAIYKGIIDSSEELATTIKGPLLTVEPFNSLYDIINGILAPILNGIHVFVGKGETLPILFNSFKNIEANTLYINNKKLESLLKTLEQEVPSIFKLLGLKRFKIKRLFDKKISKFIKSIITHGKIENRKLFNSIKRKYTVLYVMSEVSSYVASGTWTKLPRHLWLTARSNVSINTTGNVSDFGELNLICDDLFHSYLLPQKQGNYFNATIPQTSPKDLKGKFRTEDIGLIRNNKILIKNKTKNIFVNEKGIVIESGKILSIARRFKIVNEASIAIHKNELILLIELDVNSISNSTSFLNVEDVNEEIKKLKFTINNNVKPFSKIKKVIPFTNPEGLPRKNFKIVSYHF